MEDSGGRYGVDLTAFGPYRMPGKSHEYAMEFQGGTACPAGDTCNQEHPHRRPRRVGRRDRVAEVPAGFDFVFFLSAGQDESSTWQEFGMMKFPTKEDVTDDFGPPDPALPNWSNTRYVDWTSWAAGSSIWPNAGGGSLDPGRELRHGRVTPTSSATSSASATTTTTRTAYRARRAYTGIWEMLSRGSFNGPGGPHSRWMIPATGGALDGRATHAAQQDQAADGRRAERAAAVARGAGDVGRGDRRTSPRGPRSPGRRACPASTSQLGGTGDLGAGLRRRPRTRCATAAATRTTRSRSSTGWAPTRSRPTPACCWPRPRTRTRRRSSGSSTPTRRTST